MFPFGEDSILRKKIYDPANELFEFVSGIALNETLFQVNECENSLLPLQHCEFDSVSTTHEDEDDLTSSMNLSQIAFVDWSNENGDEYPENFSLNSTGYFCTEKQNHTKDPANNNNNGGNGNNTNDDTNMNNDNSDNDNTNNDNSNGLSQTLKIRLSSKIERIWYSGRVFPTFAIDTVDALNNHKICPDGWKVMVSIYDGCNSLVSDKISGINRKHLFPIINGTATISGLKFVTVSSRAGGYYRIKICLVPSSLLNSVSPTETVQYSSTPFLSDKIQILSYRLFLIPKLDHEELSSTDLISKMKGIGGLTAKRFSEIGVNTILQLASLDYEILGDQGCDQLLDHLRKSRGALTRQKLAEFISTARKIVDKSNQATNSTFEANKSNNIHNNYISEGANKESHPHKKHRSK